MKTNTVLIISTMCIVLFGVTFYVSSVVLATQEIESDLKAFYIICKSYFDVEKWKQAHPEFR